MTDRMLSVLRSSLQGQRKGEKSQWEEQGCNKEKFRGALMADPETGEENASCHFQCDRAGDSSVCSSLRGFFCVTFSETSLR